MSQMTTSGSAGSDGVFAERRDRFNRWRRGRPFAGGALLILASFVIAWVPIHIVPSIILLGKALSPIFGLLFAALVFLCGIFALSRPGLADIFGIFGVIFSIFSLYGALGGLGVGLVFGIIGGVLCYAWRDEDEESDSSGGSGGTDTTNEESDFDFGSKSTEEDSEGLFGSRSVRSVGERSTVESETTGAGGRTASVGLFVVTVVVLGAFAHPFVVTAAQQPFPEQAQIEGTVVIAEEFSGTFFNHQNVTTDTSRRTGVPAARLSFRSADIQGLTIYKNFRSGPQTPFYISITGTSASAQDLSITASEAYFGKLGIGVDPVVIPAARKKWTTCPGKDFLLSVGDLGPLPGPPVDASSVVLNTHRTTAGSITIKNLKLTVEKGTKSTSVSGTPECTTNPVEPVLELFSAAGLELLTDKGVVDPTVVTNSTVANLTAPETVNQSKTFTVSARITNTGYINDTMTVEYRFANETRRTKNVTLGRDESTTITFEDTANVSAGIYEYGVFTRNGSATGTITVTEPSNGTNVMANTTTATLANATVANATTTAGNTTPTRSAPTTQSTPEPANETASTDSTAGSSINETTPTTTATPTPTTTSTSTATTTPTATPTPATTTTTPTATATSTATSTPTTNNQAH
jgi:hypothetical protein